MDAIVKTDFNFPGQVGKYVGKVRDVYDIDGKYLVMVVSDRISAFDVVLPKGIPFKGQILNQIAAKFLDATSDILPNWKIATPDPMVTVATNVSRTVWKWLSADVLQVMRGVNIRKENVRCAVWRFLTEWLKARRFRNR